MAPAAATGTWAAGAAKRIVLFLVVAELAVVHLYYGPSDDASYASRSRLSDRLALHTLSFVSDPADPPGQQSADPDRKEEWFGRLPRCKILVTNSIANHAEILESIANLPLDMYALDIGSETSARACDPMRLTFDFALKADGMMWTEYFLDVLRRKYNSNGKNDNDDDGASRRMGELVKYDRSAKYTSYRAIIEATCHCLERDFVWMKASQRHRCVLHRRCLRAGQNDQRFLSASPFNPRFFLPNVLPEVDEDRRRQRRRPGTMKRPPYELCVIGRNYRRNFTFLRAYLDTKANTTTVSQAKRPIAIPNLPFHVRIFGSSEIKPPVLNPYNRHHVTLTNNLTDFVAYQTAVFETCDAVLALVDRISHPEYFGDQLTGTVAQSNAYNIPIVIHEELADLYRDSLPELYATHGDDNATFATAVDTLLERLDSSSEVKQRQR